MRFIATLLLCFALLCGSVQACAPAVALATPFASTYQVAVPTYVTSLQFVQYPPQVTMSLPTVSYQLPRLVQGPVDPLVDPAPVQVQTYSATAIAPLVPYSVGVSSYGYGSNMLAFHRGGFRGLNRVNVNRVRVGAPLVGGGGVSITNVQQRSGLFGLRRQNIQSIQVGGGAVGGGAAITNIQQRGGLFRRRTNILQIR